ncbi:hypothetical protein ACKFKF_28350 [Phormidesmis sp. 146-12]
MLKLRVSLAIVLSTTILGGVLLSAPVNACSHTANSTGFGSKDKSSAPFGRSAEPGRSTPSNPSSNTIQANLNSFGSPTDLKIAGAGLLAIAGFLGLGLVQKARRKPDTKLDGMLTKHPEFEHPELMLTDIPREGCASEKSEAFSVR